MTPRTSQRSRSCSASSSPRVSETDLYACDQSACEYTQYPSVAGSVSKGSSGWIAPRRSPQPSVFGVRTVRDGVAFVADDADVARQTRAVRAHCVLRERFPRLLRGERKRAEGKETAARARGRLERRRVARVVD